MSNDVPTPSASSPKSISNSPNQNVRKHRRKYGKFKLPTPPPDPRAGKKESCTENEFLEYLENLQKHTANYSRSSTTLATALVTENAFDHLERLYKLMEQMLELRAQNAKLHRKIRDLEHLNNLERMYRQVENQAEEDACSELDKDTAFAETILESILYEPKQYLKSKGSLRQSIIGKHRNRSSSAIDKPIGFDTVDPNEQRRASLSVSSTKKPSKVSKWTKVKAAFKWEKASTNVGDSKSLDSGISGVAPAEAISYLRVPSNDDAGHSPSDSGAAEISTPGSLSSASSNENFHKAGHRCHYEEPRSSDDEHSHVYSSHSKEDSNISPISSQRSPRTTWARMKDIMNTRNPVRRKKLSSHSDDIQIDIELCSENEEVFEATSKSNSFSNYNEAISERTGSDNEIPLEVRQRYRSSDENYTDHNQLDGRKISKWTKVKKAFLPALDSNEDTSGLKDNVEEDGTDQIQSEINRNYRHLQKKLSIEFQEKLTEWKKIKQSNTSATTVPPSCSNTEEVVPPNTAFMKKMEEWEKIKLQPTKTKSTIQMTREENLPPDFKKKLHEWEKMKKLSVRKNLKKPGDDFPRSKAIHGSKIQESSPIEIPVISEEFKKKLQEWKQIKASGYKSDDAEKKNIGNKTPSPKLHRMDSKASKQQDKELQWYEKELNKIEKEKGRLEKERQKYMETEEKLSKLRRTVTGGNKKDILVHTPCGFYKFEGISRKFTQKLYEWEKSRGIGPESSTFALLNPGYPSPTIPKVKINGKDQTPPLTRSRSVDSMVVSTMECPLKSQPSSLSLNDVDELEATCLRDSKTSSVDFIPCSEMEVEEPEALIVEVEDFVEETAAPLKSFIEQHNPVYQCESVRALCEGETCLAPKIRRSESTRAQTNYNLIEEIFTALNQIADTDDQIRKDQLECLKNETSAKFQEDCDRQKYFVFKVTDKLQRLQDANALVVLNITKENQNYPSNHIIDVLEIVQDLSIEIVGLSDKLNELVDKRRYEKLSCHDFDSLSVQETTDEIRNKLLELRRHLSYVCAASDSTAPVRRGLCRMKSIVCQKSSNESRSTVSDLSQNSEMSGLARRGGIYEKFDSRNQQSQGAVKKRIRYRVENIRRKSLQDSDDEELSSSTDQKKCPKFLRARTLSETSTRSSEPEEAMKNRNTNIFPVASKSTFTESPAKINPTDSPVTIFVKTTRKLFTPLIERSFTESELLKRDSKQKSDDVDVRNNLAIDSKDEEVISAETHDFHDVKNVDISSLPPLPTSPVAQKKYLKDVSPSIQLMLNKYHQKLSGQDSSNKSGGSSGSASPKAWRSPTAERRVKTQTEKYLEELSKSSSQSISSKVQKSASQSTIGKESVLSSKVIKSNTTSTFTERNILKSTSVADLYSNLDALYLPARALSEKTRTNNQSKPSNLNSSMHPMNLIWSERCSERLEKLRKAREEFFNSGPSSAPPLDTNSENFLQFPKRNRLSQISVESGSSTGSLSPGILIKSVSAGMINIAAEAYKQFEGSKPREYVSLPRNTKSDAPKKSALTNIAAKFRKVKMRRGKDKDKDKFPAVSELCRQSLVVDINQSNNQQQVRNSDSTACMGNQFQSVPIPKSHSWISRTKLFKH